MKKLIYSCEWEKNKETSWSGTNMAVRKRIAKEFDVVDFDYGFRRPYALISKIIKRLTRKIIDTSSHYSQAFKRKFKGGNLIFQFGHTPFSYDASNKHFIYQDLSWGNVEAMMENEPNIFKISGYAHLNKKYIKESADRQNEFYKHDNVYCLAMGHWLADYFVKRLGISPSRVCFAGGGCNIDNSKIDTSRKAGNKFLFVGKDFERKNGPLVVEAFRKLRKENPKYELYIAGPSNLEIDEKGIHNLGLLSFSELVEYFNLCDVFVMPSRFEAYGIVFGEALSFGLPCIGRNAYEMPYFIQEGENGYLLKDKDDPDELASLMKQAIENEKMRDYVKENHVKYIALYSWDGVVKRMTDFINSK